MNETTAGHGPTPLVEFVGVSKAYGDAPVLDGCNLTITSGESVAITGPSGCGKTTLLNLIGAMDRTYAGQVKVVGQEISGLNEKQGASLRREDLGFVFQHHHLLPQCTALENVLVPVLAKSNRVTSDTVKRARTLLCDVGMADRIEHRPSELSGGQRQRVALVRALINQPRLLLADEPTGSLDEEATGHLTDLLLKLNREQKLTLMVVTHNLSVACRMSRCLSLQRGKLHEAPPVEASP